MRLTEGLRVLVKQDEDGKPVGRVGQVTRVCTDGERAWIRLDAKGGGASDEKVRAYGDDCEPSTDTGTRAERRAAAKASTEPAPTIAVFGKDHWSTFLYIETRIVDHRGVPDRRNLRCHANRHPFLMGTGPHAPGDGSRYPTRLKGGVELAHHDDWDCIDDLEREGLLVNIGTGVNPCYELTDRGRDIAAQLRAHRAKQLGVAVFEPRL